VDQVPAEVEEYVARHKLESMGIKLDTLSADQQHYLSDWEQGT
jgi:adenosylhomocysteinase